MFLRRLFAVLLIALAFAIGERAAGQTPKQQLNEIVRDTQKQGNRAGRSTLVWWMLPEFWRLALISSGTLPADKVEEMVSSIRDVNVFAVVDVKISGFSADYTKPEELRKGFAVIDSQNQAVPVIPEQKQSTATKNMLGIMKPVMANMLGEFGKNITFIVTEGKRKDGSRRIDPAKPGTLLVKLNVEEFRWRLPLGSLLPEKICPKCNETFSGSYAFCPFDATPLKEKSSGQH